MAIINFEYKEDRIKDYDYAIDLGLENSAELITDKLVCELDSLIITANKVCEILVEFYEISEVTIFHDMQFYGSKYVAVRSQVLTPQGELLLPAFAKFLINNKIKITVKGSQETVVNITLRTING
jgi:hypothetical protein